MLGALLLSFVLFKGSSEESVIHSEISFNMTKLSKNKRAFLRRYSVPLLISGIVCHHYFYIRGTRVEVKGIRYNNSTYFYFIYKGFVEVASDLISLKKAALNMGISCFHTYSFVK